MSFFGWYAILQIFLVSQYSVPSNIYVCVKTFLLLIEKKTFGSNTKLISVTDTQGTIIECNDAFVEVSGFEKHELIDSLTIWQGILICHQKRIKKMWHYLKAGKPWMGLVKNRCKNGDFYWVDAYVTP